MVKSGGQQVIHEVVFRSAADVEKVPAAVATDTLGVSPGYTVWDNSVTTTPVLDKDIIVLLSVQSDSGRTHGNVAAT